VLVHKLVCRGTVEEADRSPHRSKQSLARGLLEGGGEAALLTEMSQRGPDGDGGARSGFGDRRGVNAGRDEETRWLGTITVAGAFRPYVSLAEKKARARQGGSPGVANEARTGPPSRS